MIIQLKSFPDCISNKAKLKHPNVTEQLCVHVSSRMSGLANSRKNSCLFQLSVTHVKWLTHSWVDVFIFRIPLQSSHIHRHHFTQQLAHTGGRLECSTFFWNIFHRKRRAVRAIMATNKNPWFNSSHNLKIPVQKNTHLPVFFPLQCLYYAELCLGYANSLSSPFFPSGCDIQARTGPPHPMVFR